MKTSYLTAIKNTMALAAFVLFLVALPGCVSKTKARAQANAAFIAGQQQAMARMQQNQSQAGMVRINGQVRQAVLPWTANMTLASALLAADYFGPDPTSIYIVRDGRAIQVDPKSLLSGKDIQLMSGDVVQINAGPTAASPAAPPK